MCTVLVVFPFSTFITNDYLHTGSNFLKEAYLETGRWNIFPALPQGRLVSPERTKKKSLGVWEKLKATCLAQTSFHLSGDTNTEVSWSPPACGDEATAQVRGRLLGAAQRPLGSDRWAALGTQPRAAVSRPLRQSAGGVTRPSRPSEMCGSEPVYVWGQLWRLHWK